MDQHENTTHEDHELLLLSLQDPSVFGNIVDRYQEPFLRKALSILGNEDDAEDVVQEVFTRIYVNAAAFEKRAGATFNSWAYKILTNACYSHYKKHKRERSFSAFDDSIALELEGAPEESLSERFLMALSRIPERGARLLRAVVLEGKSYSELSRIEGVREGTLRVRVHRAKAEFKKALAHNPHL